MLEWQCDKSREDLLVEKKLKKYTLPFIAAILTVFALSMTGLYAGSADNPGETFLSLCKKDDRNRNRQTGGSHCNHCIVHEMLEEFLQKL